MKQAYKVKQFHVIYREDDEGYIASVPSLPGCHTQGRTLAQAEARVQEAIEAYLESLSVHQETLPKKEQKVFLSSVLVPFPL